MLAAWLTLFSIAPTLFAQTTVGTGSIVGTVSDRSGAVVSGAKITITNAATGQVIELATNSSGSFNSGALIPGNYKTLVSSKGFSSAGAVVTVLVGNTATVNVNLQVGNEKEVIEVQDSALILFHARDYDASIKMALSMLRRDPNDGMSHCLLFNDYFKIGSYKEAIDHLSQCYSLYGYTKAALNMRHAFAAAGFKAAVQRWARDVEYLQATNQVYLPGNLATAYTILGDKDRAFYWLEQGYEHREMVSVDGGVFFLGTEPMYDPLRSDPRYKDLLRRVGLPP